MSNINKFRMAVVLYVLWLFNSLFLFKKELQEFFLIHANFQNGLVSICYILSTIFLGRAIFVAGRVIAKENQT